MKNALFVLVVGALAACDRSEAKPIVVVAAEPAAARPSVPVPVAAKTGAPVPANATRSHCYNVETFGVCTEYTTGLRVMGHKFLQSECERKRGTYGAGACPSTPALIGTCVHGGDEAERYYASEAATALKRDTPSACQDECKRVWLGKWKAAR